MRRLWKIVLVLSFLANLLLGIKLAQKPSVITRYQTQIQTQTQTQYIPVEKPLDPELINAVKVADQLIVDLSNAGSWTAQMGSAITQALTTDDIYTMHYYIVQARDLGEQISATLKQCIQETLVYQSYRNSIRAKYGF